MIDEWDQEDNGRNMEQQGVAELIAKKSGVARKNYRGGTSRTVAGKTTLREEGE